MRKAVNYILYIILNVARFYLRILAFWKRSKIIFYVWFSGRTTRSFAQLIASPFRTRSGGCRWEMSDALGTPVLVTGSSQSGNDKIAPKGPAL